MQMFLFFYLNDVSKYCLTGKYLIILLLHLYNSWLSVQNERFTIPCSVGAMNGAEKLAVK